jgi:hypothetical protein
MLMAQSHPCQKLVRSYLKEKARHDGYGYNPSYVGGRGGKITVRQALGKKHKNIEK